MFEGLKGQFNELENELAKIREGALKKPSAEPSGEAPKISEPPAKEEPKIKDRSVIEKAMQKVKPPEAPKKDEEVPGFPRVSKVPEDKTKARPGVPSDTDFLKAQPTKLPEETSVLEGLKVPEAPKAPVPGVPPVPGIPPVPGVPPGTFKLTNVNKPKEPEKPKEKDKTKSKRETLIPGFHPKEQPPEISP